MYKVKISYHVSEHGGWVSKFEIADSFEYFYMEYILYIRIDNKEYKNIYDIEVDGIPVVTNHKYKDDYGRHGVVEITEI